MTVSSAFGQYQTQIFPKNASLQGIVDGKAIGNVQISNTIHASIWSLGTESFVDLHNSNYTFTSGNGISENSQVGQGERIISDVLRVHALLWHGTAGSLIDLNPTNWIFSNAIGVHADHQVGLAVLQIGSKPHACMWTSSNTSFIDLNPIGFIESRCNTIWGNGQGGAIVTSAGKSHAEIWSGTAASAIDVQPNFVTESEIVSMFDQNQVGYGFVPVSNRSDRHAILWHGSAASAIDLNPTDFIYSDATSTNATYQVGSGIGFATQQNSHAFRWQGTSQSAYDLHKFLPSEFTDSYATGIDEAGNIIGRASKGGVYYPVMWAPVPEPASYISLGIGAMILISRRRSRK